MTPEAQRAEQAEGWSIEIKISHYRVENGELVREYHDSLYNGSLTEAEARAWYQRAYSCMDAPALLAGADALRQQDQAERSSPSGLAAKLVKYHAQHEPDCAYFSCQACGDPVIMINNIGDIEHRWAGRGCDNPVRRPCTCGLAALITTSGDEGK